MNYAEEKLNHAACILSVMVLMTEEKDVIMDDAAEAALIRCEAYVSRIRKAYEEWRTEVSAIRNSMKR